ncbi:helix-turn-helix transcriptional regulator|uniref:AraC-type DNA-binding protein n=1 Tax=Dendrosporobacter quercicolus TaxID=146817 RepID=A0A1G9RST9_9FIRM|nr:AraC family transcriptional regulator [Dendrosporobacter quercicolus]NSL49359.1 helix-turn-helix transcriptional regulator [Dendrosporobacter quercicolus DSM 1736]SDM26281.1 AraC-type DNA-binding protein [Dendrosporobacter quercicolus]
MEVSRKEKNSYGKNITVVKQNEACTVYQMKDGSGEGTMTCYQVFPGIDLIYNDFHMPGCFSEFQPKVNMLGIDHCREGRIEWEFQNGSYLYLAQGDLQISSKDNHTAGFGFPLSHYHGITVAIYIDEALPALAAVSEGFPVDITTLREKFCTGKRPFIMRAQDSIQHIFSELYTVPEQIKKTYFKIKVLELLLFLSTVEAPSDSGDERRYFPRSQVNAVKAVMNYICENLDRRFTLKELSDRFCLPLTTLKLCFKGVYGCSVQAYLRSYRMQAAALMLRQSKDSIAVIAGKVGYDNASKFAAAFKLVTGRSPQEYRKSVV